MILRTIEASAFAPLPKHIKDVLLKSGVIPVNDIFLPAWGIRKSIILLYGGFGSGKTVNIVDELLYKACNDEYFRCFYGRKILDSVRKTVFQTFIDRIKYLNLQRYFSYSEAPNGTMRITHKKSGNFFEPFGCSDSESLKGIKDPTHIFVDEVDQISWDDFVNLYSRLRTEQAFTQFYGACNTEKVYKSHWIRRVLFGEVQGTLEGVDLSDTMAVDEYGELKDLVYTLKANYVDNHFINKQKYYNQLKLLAAGDQTRLNAMAAGAWGSVRTGFEFWKSFNELLHVKEVTIAKAPMHISIDENVNPYVTQTIWQVFADKKQITQIRELLSKSPNNNAPKAARQLVEWLISIDFKDVLYIYGDPSAGKRSTVDENNASFYDKYIAVLRSYGFKVVSRVGKSAPEVALSANFINAIYEQNLGGWNITIGSLCFGSIEDYMIVKEDADGRILKLKVKDEETKITYEPNGHCSDAKRYFITTLLNGLFAQYKERKRTLFAV